MSKNKSSNKFIQSQELAITLVFGPKDIISFYFVVNFVNYFLKVVQFLFSVCVSIIPVR